MKKKTWLEAEKQKKEAAASERVPLNNVRVVLLLDDLETLLGERLSDLAVLGVGGDRRVQELERLCVERNEILAGVLVDINADKAGRLP